MGECGWRALVLGPSYLPAPHRDAVAHATRCELEPKISPIGCVRCAVESRLAIKAVEIGTDELAVFDANAGVIHEVGYPAGGIDLIIRTAGGACLNPDDLDAVVERLLDDDDAREPSVGRAVCDIQFHEPKLVLENQSR